MPFFIGGAARLTASLSMLPFNVIRTRLQQKRYTEEKVKELKLRDLETNKRSERSYTGMIDCAKTIYRHEGPRGFFKGLTPLILK